MKVNNVYLRPPGKVILHSLKLKMLRLSSVLLFVLTVIFLMTGSVINFGGSSEITHAAHANHMSIFEFDFESSWSVSSGLVVHLLILLGALGLFIYGMKTMSEGIQKASASPLRKVITNITSSKWNGIFTGLLTTSVVQSSSATTVMVVSFVNNGVLNLRQSIAIIMGANIGTTITGWLIAVFGFVAPVGDYSLIIFLIAIAFLFSNKGRIKSWGESLAGLAILFMALELLKAGIPHNKMSVDQFNFLNEMSGIGVWNVILALIIGAVITIVVQSSTAALLITILLCERAIIPYELGMGMVLGGNIGTTITSNIAAISGNVHAKRAAMAHLVLNLIGAIWMVFAFRWFIVGVDGIVLNVFGMENPQSNGVSRTVGLALFHTSFNVINVLLTVWFLESIAVWVVRLVPKKLGDDEVFHLDYIAAGVLATPELSIIEAKKEVAKFGTITSKMLTFFSKLLVETDNNKKKYFYDKIAKYEEITDRVEVEISNFLAKAAENELSDDTSRRVRGMLAIINDLERIGDIFYHMSLTLNRKEIEKVWFSPEQRKNLIKMIGLVDEAFTIMVENLQFDYSIVSVNSALAKENEVNDFRDFMRSEHFENIEKQEYNVKSGIFYSDLFYSLEEIGDHIMNVTEAIVGERDFRASNR